MQFKIIFLSFLLLFLLPSEIFSQSTEDINYLYANELDQYIANTLKSCKIVEIKDYDKEILSFFKPTTKVLGDFDGNGFEDICLIIKCPQRISVISFHKFKNGFKHYILETREGSNYIQETLIKENAGPVRISMADEEVKTKKLAHVAITVEWIETCYNTIYIWENDQYVSFYRGL